MKTSKLIELLQEELEQHGDLDVIVIAEGQQSDIAPGCIRSVDDSARFPRATLIDLD